MNRILALLVAAICILPPAFPQGSVLLVGGGSESYNDWSDKPYKWLVEHAPNRKILVLHYADTTTWFRGYFPSLSPCTVSNRFISSVAQANDSTTYRFILEHDGIFLRGGDQAQYVSKWRGTLAQKAIREVFQRGGVVGGTSAGEMVLGKAAYLGGSTDNGALIRNPSSSITLETDFLPLVPAALAESHTSERGRLGRTPAIIARYKELTGTAVTGIAADANTALAIGPDGIGEAMGASAVALLRWQPETRYAIEAGKPFSLSNMKFDQLLPGYKINLATNEISVPASAQPFNPNPLLLPQGNVILDGSGNFNDWAVVTGSLKKLRNAMPAGADTVCIISAYRSAAVAEQIRSNLLSLNAVPRVALIDNANKNNPALASVVASGAAFVFAGNVPDSIAVLLDTNFAVGAAFKEKRAAGIPMAFLGEDVMAAGEKIIIGLYGSLYAAYYGTLSLAEGLGVVKGVQFVPRFYQNQNNSQGYDYSENRIMGMMWAMGKARLGCGMMIDAGSHLVCNPNGFEAGGISAFPTPVLFLDYRQGTVVDFSVFRRPGRTTPVQNAAFINGRLHFIRAGESYLVTAAGEKEENVETGFALEQNYPNPFNPETTIKYLVPGVGLRTELSETSNARPADGLTVKLTVYDILGREVSTLVNKEQNPGEYSVAFHASSLPSGTYFYELRAGSFHTVRKMILIK